ncbi:YcgL domain-containing protein [Alkalimonas collagenimarina]|uniref:YcgL domain-containing protein Q3O60_00485 n=1 Tax=Alkalimonas collagenimarina TaxID=400390 RepID=A0ABT9GUE8_9GAMM|nr:YcgL domain-containing protein [Alkalimonas collagenimarina]MDP4534673.1 YcgL domain-containing protein [Alkalimonas collagenimarina]
MLCTVYKSPKKEHTYLFIKRRDDFASVPESLLQTFGTPVLVTILDLNRRTSLAQSDLTKVRAALDEQGYYLQLPPPVDDLLAQNKAFLQQHS